MAVIVKDLGIASAYGYAKSKGYTGTEEEFAELMASYADVAQQAEAAAQDAEDAKDAAVSAKNDAQTAQTAAESAQAAAAGSAQTASTKASEASNSAQSAAGSASAAQTAAQTATNKASEASSSASAASTAKTGAETARTGAQSAQTAAETAQENAEAAAASVSASAAQIDQNTADIGAIKNDLSEFPNGNYPQMGAGYANQLMSGLKKEDQTPYNFRAVPYDATLEEVKKIVGGTIVNNQLIPTTSRRFENTSVERTQTMNFLFRLAGSPYTIFYNKQALADTFGDFVFIAKATTTGNAQMIHNGARTQMVFGNNISVTSGHVYCGKLNFTSSDMTTVGGVIAEDIQLTDLTLDYGISIADYVLSLETATAGAGVAWLKTHFPKQFDVGYQAYDAGSLQSVSGLTEHRMVGFNQWDEQWELGIYDISTGAKADNSSNIRNKNLIRILPNTQYCWNNTVSDVIRFAFYDADKNYLSYRSDTHSSPYVFTTPANACYMAFYYGATSYSGTLCINFHWDGEKDGTYEPYKTWSYALDDSITLRGIPKVDASGNLYYDGDEYLPDGTVNRRYGIVDLGTLTWNKQTESDKVDRYYTSDISTVVLKPSVSTMLDLVCARFIASIDPVYGRTLDNAMCVLSSNGGLYISASGYTDASAFKTAMSGVYLVYAKQTPTTETADPYQTPQIIAPDGTEEYIYTDGSFELPVGHSSDYPVNVSGQLDDILDTPSANGTYVLKATVTDGVVSYSWVADA